MHSRFLLRSRAVLAAFVLAASPAFAQIMPDTPISPPSGSGVSAAARAMTATRLTSVMDATNQAVQALSSASLEPVASRHATVLDALAAAHASPAVVDCVTKFHAAENAALADKIRGVVAKILGDLKKQRAATLAAVMKMVQQVGPAAGSATDSGAAAGSATDPGAAQDMSHDIDAAFDQMEQSVAVAQAKLLGSLR